MQKVYGDLSSVKDIVNKVLDFFPLKILLSSISIALAWIFQDDTTILISVYSLLAIDTFTGVCKGIKFEGLQSSKLSRILWKCLIYFLMLVVGRIVDRHLPIKLAAPIMDTFIVATEALSILENISQLGFPVPIGIIKMLKTYRDREK